MGARGNLARVAEQREANRRIQELATEEVRRYYAQQRGLDTISTNMLKDDVKRKEREARERHSEAAVLHDMYRSEAERQLATIRAEEEAAVTGALARQLTEQERAAREVQKLREQSTELRELAEKLRAARVNKDRAQQLQEKQVLQTQEHMYNKAFDDIMDKEAIAGLQREAESEARRKQEYYKGKVILQEQMAERLELQRAAEAEHQREKALVDEVVRRIQQEDALEAAKRADKAAETKEYIARFLEQQDEARRQAAAAEQEESRKVEQYWEMVRSREADNAGKQALRKDAADRIYDKLKREKEEQLRQQEEEEHLINLLREEEQALKRSQEEQAKREKAERMRTEIMAANERQMRIKADREAQMRADEASFAAQMMAKFAEDDRLEQLNAAKRRLKVAEHKRQVERLVAEKRAMYEALKAREEAEEAERRAAEQRQAALIDQERAIMLQQAAELRDYLPRGVYKTKAEMDYVEQLTQQRQRQQQQQQQQQQ